ncbi:hypothetical protein OGR47_09215 [Methylocystis sp. MJC1]|jgi:hypothetical protein|uniref:hypothetical protein n=1 Tax=Methylocystis sp. MJC1 TaxID=2654282 RepID=UPI0013EA9AB7|nr:hypothetical protein [Methylocystis sp. MJC1]KAF2991595.1 hypothetical protein MJC1_01160 [Methylocystis sp. MJC1]MBU6527166.1 hypothetical protein [Methylocystis sp. MJC1]UZX13599.1 hypothetical protein OGR47_09215 [Methylocystis sp. MJC1]
MKKFLVSIALVALTAGSAFAQGGAITVGGSFTPGAVGFGGVFNSAGQTLNTTVTNNAPARAGAASAITGTGNGGSATAISAASTSNTQYVSPMNYISFSNTLRQSLNY